MRGAGRQATMGDHVPRQHRRGRPQESGRDRRRLRGSWFHTGDLAASSPIAIKSGPSKDIIISGGENSSIEVEDALYRHPAVMACAVVARPVEVGRTPLASSSCAPARADAGALIAHRNPCSPVTGCRARSASSRSPRPRPARSEVPAAPARPLGRGDRPEE
jgi:fatty-acyl-CoA synthase